MPPKLREKNKERTRIAIVRAALELFVERGYDETTIPVIADEAGVSPRTVSTYFPAKADIALGPLDRIFERLRDCLDGRDDGTTTLDAIEQWMLGEVEVGDETGNNLVRRAMARNPALQVAERERIINAENAIATSLAKEHGLHKRAVGPRLLATAAVAMTFEMWGHKHVPHPHRKPAHLAQHADSIPYAMAILRAAEEAIGQDPKRGAARL